MDNDPVRALEREKLRQWVVTKVSGYVKVNNVIFEVGRRTGWNWETSKQFVLETQEDYKKEIKVRRFPILALGGTAILLVGVYLFSSAFQSAIPLITTMVSGTDFLNAFSYFLEARSGYFDLIRLFTGLAMMIGGGIGIGQAIASIW
jgi:hypothetical protein